MKIVLLISAALVLSFICALLTAFILIMADPLKVGVCKPGAYCGEVGVNKIVYLNYSPFFFLFYLLVWALIFLKAGRKK